VVVINGLGLEAWFDEALTQSDSNAEVVTASDGVTAQPDDPHVWHNPRNAIVMIDNIAAAFSVADPSQSADYEQRRSDYVARLEALDTEIEAEVATLTNRKLVTNHDAFGYFIDRYGFEFVGSVIPSFDSQAELSVAETNDLIDAIKQQGVTAIFTESSLPPKVAKAIADEAGVRIVDGEDALYGDSLGVEGSSGATYLEMMRHNAFTIVSNLQ
jgi:ABC-type Zn uptake system ZnuABC Zn-binding protein ZnuA